MRVRWEGSMPMCRWHNWARRHKRSHTGICYMPGAKNIQNSAFSWKMFFPQMGMSKNRVPAIPKVICFFSTSGCLVLGFASHPIGSMSGHVSSCLSRMTAQGLRACSIVYDDLHHIPSLDWQISTFCFNSVVPRGQRGQIKVKDVKESQITSKSSLNISNLNIKGNILATRL